MAESDSKRVAMYPTVEEEELRYLGANKNDDRWALCLSGGGIRSATFSLGVLQGLAANRWLGRFHYLSTVSGGGYIGSWLSSWIARTGLPTVMTELAGEPGSTKPEPTPVARLRSYSNYLSPVWGFSTDFFTLVSIFLRNLLLNWLVLVPLLAAVVLFPFIYVRVLSWDGSLSLPYQVGIGMLALALIVLGIAYTVADLPEEALPEAATPAETETPPLSAPAMPLDRFARGCFLPIFAAALLLSWIGYREGDPQRLDGRWSWWIFLVAGATAHSVGCGLGLWYRKARGLQATSGSTDVLDALFIVAAGAIGGAIVYGLSLLPNRLDAALYATLAVPALIFGFWLATTVYVGLARGKTSEMDREWWSRSGAWWLRACLGWLLGFALVLYGPAAFRLIPWLGELGPKSLVTGGSLLGVVTGLIGYWSHSGAQLKERAKTLASRIGVSLLDIAAIMFIVLLVIGLSYVMRETVYMLDAWLPASPSAIVLGLFGALIALGAGTVSVSVTDLPKSIKSFAAHG